MTLPMPVQPNKPVHQSDTAQRMIAEEIDINYSGAMSRYVYAVGYINAKFPSLNLEKELYQNSLMDKHGTPLPMLKNINDDIALQRLNRNTQLYQTVFKGLNVSTNRYIARSMEWIFDNRYNEQLYTLVISTEALLTQCISALGRAQNNEVGQVVIVGEILAQGDVLVHTIVPVSALPFSDVIHSESHNNAQFKSLVTEITSLDTFAGDTDATRALNYALYNNAAIYQNSYHLCYQSRSDGPNPNGYQLVKVDVNMNQSGDRLVADVIFAYQGINTGAMQFWRSRVDVTGEYPFIVEAWQQYLPNNLE
ncbi:hypothetical protein L1077_03215 [Pseudoalteromonas luteoviolacea]|uniref:cyanobactin maturation protease PatG family protein n=1 Tax=Pseudoalteromonas luteoviolacea TaxID=43657 RepID=UPI001F1A17AA|nr:hypothetical protein [Pseudoalteromonas luteoviolacea]MCF6438439.1 hypothetical protein [Pseudoalteromonas luteoviolacea]